MFALNLVDYREIFFDMDGVLIDSNATKKRNIEDSVRFLGDDFAREFAEFSAANSGIPREEKLRARLREEHVQRVLEQYSELNAATLPEVAVLPGAFELLSDLHHLCAEFGTKLFVYSGATRDEAVQVLTAKNMLQFFAEVRGGPQTKSENFQQSAHERPILFFGDSHADHEFAHRCGLDFVFVSAVTHFAEWRQYFVNKAIAGIVRNLSEVQVRPGHFNTTKDLAS